MPADPSSMLASFLTSKTLLWAVIDLVFIAIAFMTLALYYHWLRFSPSHVGAVITIAVYTTGLLILIIALLGILATL